MIVKNLQRPSVPEDQQDQPQAETGSQTQTGAAQAWEDQDRGAARRRRWIFLSITVLLAVAGVIAYGQFGDDLSGPTQPLIYQTAQRGDLPITVIERGNLESQENLEILCEVDDVSGDGIVGTQLVWIVANGTSVKEGDLLVELDEAPHLERLDRQILDTDQARAVNIQAELKYQNQITQNETLLADAELDVELADLELRMFKDPEKGTHKLEVEAIERQIEDINNEILSAQASLELKENESEGIETLFKLGYAGKRQLDQSRLEYLQAESQVAAKLNKLKTQRSTLEKKNSYEQEMELLRLDGKLETAKRKLLQVQRNGEAQLAQAKSVLSATTESLDKKEELLTRYREQLGKCKIEAPQEGMVAYATTNSRYSSEEIREGAHVRPRQKILSLPNLKQMQVRTSVHESVLTFIEPGLPTTVRVDAFSDMSYRGTVASVAVLPDSGGWYGADTKVYKTIVTIDEETEHLKPGMTAVVEIHIDRLENVLLVPIQAVVQVEDKDYCFVRSSESTPERRIVELGRTNDKFVVILSGIAEGEEVVLNPMAIIDEVESDEADSENPDEEDTPLPAGAEASPGKAAAKGAASPSDRGRKSKDNSREAVGASLGHKARPKSQPAKQAE